MARRAIPTADRTRAAVAAARHLNSLRMLRPGTRMALYAPTGEEFPTGAVAAAARRRGARLYLPRLGGAFGTMSFGRLQAPMRRNRFGIPEPGRCDRIGAAWMTLILLPLVAFDASGNRLGMGGGHYDRALQFRRRRSHWRGPLLVGLAFDVQQSEPLPIERWDVRLDAVITESGIRWFGRSLP